eukprot:1050783-Ditylum_brightwellii.AAC.1
MERKANQFESDNANGKIKCNNNSNETCPLYSKQELNAISERSSNDVNKKSCYCHCNKEKANTINQFNTISIGSSDNSSDEDKNRST